MARQGRVGSGGDIFIASPPNPPPSHMLAGPNSKSGLWPPIDGTKYAQHSHLNNGRGLNRAANGGTCYIFIWLHCKSAGKTTRCWETIAAFNLSERGPAMTAVAAWIHRKARQWLVCYLVVQESSPFHDIRVVIVFCCQSRITLQVLY